MSNTTRLVVAIVVGNLIGNVVAGMIAPHLPESDIVRTGAVIVLATAPTVIMFRVLGGAA